MIFCSFLQEHFQNCILFSSDRNILKHILALSIHTIKVLYIKRKSDNHVILEIRLSFQSNSSNGNNFIALRSNLNLLESIAKLLKSSKFTTQLHCNGWLDIADCLTFFKTFSCKIGDPHLFCSSGIKVVESFSALSNLAVTSCVTLSNSRMNFFN